MKLEPDKVYKVTKGNTDRSILTGDLIFIDGKLEHQYGCQLYQMDKTQMLIAAARIIKIKIEDKEK